MDRLGMRSVSSVMNKANATGASGNAGRQPRPEAGRLFGSAIYDKMLQVPVAGRGGKIRQFPQTAAHAPRAVLDLVNDERAGDPALLARKRIDHRPVQQLDKAGAASIIENSLGCSQRHQTTPAFATGRDRRTSGRR